MKRNTLVSIDHVCRADVDDGRVVLVHHIGLKDSNQALEPVWALIGDMATVPISDETKETDFYLYGKARIRQWQL